MKLVIEIDNDYYEIVKREVEAKRWDFLPCTLIAKGTPLPKDHGRIIDESKIEVCEWVDAWEEDYPKASTDAPTIIEADGGGEE